jgi:hypothetical protein
VTNDAYVYDHVWNQVATLIPAHGLTTAADLVERSYA